MMIYFRSWLGMIYGILWLKSIFRVGVYVDVSEHGLQYSSATGYFGDNYYRSLLIQ